MQANKNIPHSKPTISILDIFSELKGLVKLENLTNKINNMIQDNADPETILKSVKEKLTEIDDDLMYLRWGLENFLAENHLYIDDYDYSLEKDMEESE